MNIDYKALSDKMTAGYTEIGKLLADQKIDMDEYQKRAKQIQADYQSAISSAMMKKHATVTAVYHKDKFDVDVTFSIPVEVVSVLSKDDWFGVYEKDEKDIANTAARHTVDDVSKRDGTIAISLTDSTVVNGHEYVVKYVAASAYKDYATSTPFKIDVPAGPR